MWCVLVWQVVCVCTYGISVWACGVSEWVLILCVSVHAHLGVCVWWLCVCVSGGCVCVWWLCVCVVVVCVVVVCVCGGMW